LRTDILKVPAVSTDIKRLSSPQWHQSNLGRRSEGWGIQTRVLLDGSPWSPISSSVSATWGFPCAFVQFEKYNRGC